MHPIRTSCLLAFLLMLAAATAHAEEVETDGFTVKIPPGYTKLLDSEAGTGGFTFPMANNFMGGEPDMKTYFKGSWPEPDAAIVAIYMPMKGDQTSISDAELGIAGDQLGAMLPQGFSMEKKTFQGEFEGIVIRCRLEDIPTAHGIEGEFRMATIACGDYAVFLGLVNFSSDAGATADMEWTRLLGSLDIHPPTDWMMILLIALSCSSVIIFFVKVLLKKPPQIRYATDSGSTYAPRGTGGRTMDGLPDYGRPPEAEPAPAFTPATADLPPAHTPVPPPNRPQTEPGTGLGDPLATPAPAPQPAKPAPRPQPTPASTPDAPGSGLRSTLPASGRWSDQFGGGDKK
ncbi:MAG: hypothetical protein QNJ98_02610 [Planctomycetota bacterium]|nr:hypothetical protein [Planctomycetota bacterium]